MKNKHLTLSERITIQEMLERKQSFRTIASSLGKSVATISREVRRNRYKKAKANLFIECGKKKNCSLTHFSKKGATSLLEVRNLCHLT